jgi:uncharacterized membrane protein
MTMRLQELHPAMVHFPITMLPTTLLVDAIGRLTRNGTLLHAGKVGIAATAGSAALSAVAGLLAQEASRFDRDAHDKLVTHRNLNLAVIGMTVVMAARRAQRRRPSIAYLLTGAAGVAAMTYSAYLGGNMVYEHGVGVDDAGGLREEEAPFLVPANARHVLQVSGRHVVSGLRHAVRDLASGRVVPWLTRAGTASRADTALPKPD